MFSDEIRLSYSGEAITSKSAKTLGYFSNLVVLNNLPIEFVLPGIIQAENFVTMSGFQTEST